MAVVIFLLKTWNNGSRHISAQNVEQWPSSYFCSKRGTMAVVIFLLETWYKGGLNMSRFFVHRETLLGQQTTLSMIQFTPI